ncbi:ABC transporter permease [Bosea minatitlanensis]|uniref:ABC transporter permease n=1 Tax=Bosea minatitlanensis TaxID=128782 RepID=A0ABW0F5Q0_9HYPH|nr:ABC transporter permease [Bosea minatitlanensis]MCT4494161.1 ABC transporter permease [Bosea minatitlanensis]
MNRIVSVLVGRLLSSAIVLVALSIIVFAFIRAIPGDPVEVMMGTDGGSPEQAEALRRELGLDRPVHVQYLAWAERALHGDFGQSLLTQEPVLSTVLQRLQATTELALVAIFLGAVIGIVVGTLAAVKRGKLFDAVVMVATLSGVSLPVFWAGTMLIVLFSVFLDIFPTGGMLSFDTRISAITGFPLLDAILSGNLLAVKDILRHMVLPALTLTLGPAALIARSTRASVLEVINEDYVNAGLARGLSYRAVVWRHVMRNAMIPVVTIIGLEINVYLAGSIVTETVFAWPGLGRHMMQAINSNDYPVVQGVIVVYAALIVFVNLAVDLLYGLVDPRIRS